MLCIVRSRTTLHQGQFHRFLFFCYVLSCYVLLDHVPPFIIPSLRIFYLSVTRKYCFPISFDKKKCPTFRTDLAKAPRKTTSQRLLRLRLRFRPRVVVAMAIQHYAAGHASAWRKEAAKWEMPPGLAADCLIFSPVENRSCCRSTGIYIMW